MTRQEIAAIINSDPLLMSLLYDLDLLPEQVKEGSRDEAIMMIVIAHWQHKKESVK